MTWNEYEGVPVGIYIPGNIFGDLEVYKNSSRLFSCVAITRLETFTMTKQDFRRILFVKYPTIGKTYLSIMDFKLLELEKVMQIIVNCMFEGTRCLTPEHEPRPGRQELEEIKEQSPGSMDVHVSPRRFEIQDSEFDHSQGDAVRFEKGLLRNQTVKCGGRRGAGQAEDPRFKSLGVKIRGPVGEKKSEEIKPNLYTIESGEEEEELQAKMGNIHKIEMLGINKNLGNQTKMIIKRKLNFMKTLSLKLAEKEPKNPELARPDRLENSEITTKDKSSLRTESRQMKTLVQTSSLQIESQSSILRQTVLRNLLSKYSRKSVVKQSNKDSLRSSVKRPKKTDFLLRKIEELTRLNQGLMQKNEKLESDQKSILQRLGKFSDFVESLG